MREARKRRHFRFFTPILCEISSATVSRVLRRLGLNKLNALESAEPVGRYEREKPGELIHLDIKKLGRIGSVGTASLGDIPAR